MNGARQAGKDVDLVEPGYEEHQLHLNGLTWAEIAKERGLPNHTVAYLRARAYLEKAAKEMSQEERRVSLQRELDLLEMLRRDWIPLARQRDAKAVDIVLSVSDRIVKWLALGLETDSNPTSSNTVLVMGNTEQYVTSIKKILGEENRAEIVDVDVVEDDQDESPERPTEIDF